MGAILLEIYEIVTNRTGIKGRMRLAVKTGVSRLRASELEDDQETVVRFKKAATDILGAPLE
jgi:hypothetical protein